MIPAVFDICKGAIPGSTHLFFSRSIIANTCLTVGGASAALLVTKQVVKRLPFFSTPQWHVYRFVQKVPSLSGRQVVIGGGALVLSVCIIGAFYPYLGLFLNSPFPKAFFLKFRQLSRSTITAVVGVGVFVGTTFISTFFGMNIFSDPFKPLNQLKITFFGPKQKIWRPKDADIKTAGNVNITSVVSFFKMKVFSELPEMDADSHQIQIVDWTSLPADIFRIYIFPRTLNRTPKKPSNFQDFFACGQICKKLRAYLLDPVCLIPRSPYRHFLWHVFRKQQFDPIEVAAFFQMYLPEGHQGDGLRVPMRFLFDGIFGLKNSVTPNQLAYIYQVLPKASIDAITVRLGGDDDVVQVADAINAYLETSKKMFSLTIIPEIIRNPEEVNLYGRLLTKQEYKERWSFKALWINQLEKAQKNYPSQVMKLLPLLKGRVTILRIDFHRHSTDTDLNPKELMEFFKPATGISPLFVDRVYFAYTWKLKCKPPEDRKKFESIVEVRREDIEYPPKLPNDSLIDETLTESNEIDQPRETEIFRIDYLG